MRVNNMGENKVRYAATWVKPVLASSNNKCMIELLEKYHALKPNK